MFYVLLGIALVTLVYFKIIKPTKFWEEKGITNTGSWALVGNMLDLLLRRKHLMHVTIDLYNKYPNDRYVGFAQFLKNALLIRDIDLIKKMGVKDFDNFHDHGGFITVESDPLTSNMLLSLTGEKWRQMRATLSPAFTSSKMRNMFILMKDCADNFVGHFQGKEPVAIEMSDIFTKFTTDVIATTAFGIKTDSVNEPKNGFYSAASDLIKFGFSQIFKILIIQISPLLANVLKLKVFSESATNLFRSIVKENIAKREAEHIVRPDMIQLLMEARKGLLKHETHKEDKSEGFSTVEESYIGKNADKLELTDDQIVAQAVLFFFGGFVSFSTAACFLAHELAVNPDIQKKLQHEIDSVNESCNGKVTYESLLGMKYFDQVISEVLRLWTTGFQTDRLCVKDYVIEPVNPHEKALTVEKGVLVVFPIMGIHRDPQYFPEPERFDPERFNDANKDKIVAGSYMPFGIGPRNCIGSRFALLEIKILFFSLLTKFDIMVTDKTEIPIKLCPKHVVGMAPASGFWLAFRPRNITEI